MSVGINKAGKATQVGQVERIHRKY